MTSLADALLDLPPYPPERMAGLADRLAAVLHTHNDILIVQGEAIVALEAVATSIARPGSRALNIVTSPYGDWFGQWLERGGATVDNLHAGDALPIAAGAVESALAAGRYDIVALVHAESASGILNPLPQIAALAKTHGALLVVDAVASVGGHELDVDGLGIDIAVIGPQKSLGGSAGISALSVSETAWERILAPGLVRQSILSLADLKLNWLDQGRGALPGMPSSLELQALDAALARIESEGLEHVIARHQRAADATRAAIAALGLPAFTDAASASNLTTGALLPAGITVDAAVEKLAPFGVGIAPSIGAAAKRLLRINHTGNRARFEPVLANVMALGAALHQLGHAADLAAAGGAVLDRYGREAP